MSALADGRYDVIIIDAKNIDARTTRVDFAITSGALKGEVASVRAHDLQRDETALLGLPATLFVENGTPRLAFD